MKYKVIKFFTDLKDNDYPYNVGSFYPREGLKVSESRVEELSSKDNKRGEPLIEVVREKKAPAKEKATKKVAKTRK